MTFQIHVCVLQDWVHLHCGFLLKFVLFHKDEVVAANCVSFNLDGSRIYCGFNKMVRVFDTARPGRDFQERPTVGEFETCGLMYVVV